MFGLTIGNDIHTAIYPNPTHDIINIITNNINQTVYLNDALGRTLQQFNTVPTQIDLSELPAGVYFIKIGDTVSKIVKE